jgi:hypothetical protein
MGIRVGLDGYGEKTIACFHQVLKPPTVQFVLSLYTGYAFPGPIYLIYKYCEFSKVRCDALHLEIQVDTRLTEGARWRSG